MTNIPVDNDLYRQLCDAAAAEGRTVDEFVGEALRQALSVAGVRQTFRNGLPVMVVSGSPPQIDSARVRQSLEDEGF